MNVRKWYAIVLLGMLLVDGASATIDASRLIPAYYSVKENGLEWCGTRVNVYSGAISFKDDKRKLDLECQQGRGKLMDGVFGEKCPADSDSDSFSHWFGGKSKNQKAVVNFYFNKTKRLSSVSVNVLSSRFKFNNSLRYFSIFSDLSITTYWNGKRQLWIDKQHQDPEIINCTVKNITIPLFNVAATELEMNFTFPKTRFGIGEIEFRGKDIQTSTEIPCSKPFTDFRNSVKRTSYCIATSIRNTSSNSSAAPTCSQRQCPQIGCEYTCLVAKSTSMMTPENSLNLTYNGWKMHCSLQFANTNDSPVFSNLSWSEDDLNFPAKNVLGIYSCSTIEFLKSSGTVSSPSVPRTIAPASTTASSTPFNSTFLVPAASGLSDGALAGIIIGILLVIAAVLILLFFVYYRRCGQYKSSRHSLEVEGMKYEKTNGREGVPPPLEPESPYAIPPDCHLPAPYTVNGSSGANGGNPQEGGADYAVVAITPTETAAPASLVSIGHFPSGSGQVAEVPFYAEASQSGILNRTKTTPSKSKKKPKRDKRLGSTPARLVMTVNVKVETRDHDDDEENIYEAEPAGVPTTSPPVPPKSQSLTDRKRHQSGDSGVEDSETYHVYESVDNGKLRPRGASTVPRCAKKVVNLEIYASVDAVKRHSQLLSQRRSIVHEEDLTPEFLLDASLSSESPLSPTGMLPYQSVYADPAPLLHEQGPLELPAEKFTSLKLIGQGQFGEVYQAFATQLLMEDFTEGRSNGLCVRSTNVALKYLRKGATRDMQEAFNKEVKFMAPLQHEHVVRLLGVCSAEHPHFMVIEYMENGDLNQYLQRFTHPGQSETASAEKSIAYSTLLQMSFHIASGMQYLESKFFIHRDLATRNCLVGGNHVVKVADFGMTRSVYEKNYYRLAGRAILPIRWMAPETFYGKFTIKTDVWSFGVTCWEIFTLARCQPYQEMSDKDVIENAVNSEGRIVLERPDMCDDAMYGIMMQCWSQKPEDRPAFGELPAYILCRLSRRSC